MRHPHNQIKECATVGIKTKNPQSGSFNVNLLYVFVLIAGPESKALHQAMPKQQGAGPEASRQAREGQKELSMPRYLQT